MMISPIQCACGGDCSTHIECRCTGWERFRNKDRAPFPKKYVFWFNRLEDGVWELCRYCGKIQNFPGYLVVCPECNKKFKGPRPYFPVDYECDYCG